MVVKRLFRRVLDAAGYDLIPKGQRLADFTVREREIIASVQPFTMTTVERLAASLNAVTYLVSHNIDGDIVECGVWRGGSMMAIARGLMAAGDTQRHLYLYDTFEGMPPPGPADRTLDGRLAADRLARVPRDSREWCAATLEEVRDNLLSTGYPGERIHFVKGRVEETIPATAPVRIGLLRLDTDWYESTRHELQHLFPRICAHGVLIVDDYGHWQGARKAVDEYFRENHQPVYLHRIDYTGRTVIRP
jgi:hypothetical protein